MISEESIQGRIKNGNEHAQLNIQISADTVYVQY